MEMARDEAEGNGSGAHEEDNRKKKSMPRRKQTARKSTGGKAPRKQLATKVRV